MLGTRHILPFLLGTLLLSAACQKIDEDMLNANKSDQTNNSSDSDSVATSTDDTKFVNINEHIVILKSDTNAIYISLNEWSNILSAYSTSPSQATDIAKSYREGSITGWRIPTKAEAQSMKEVYLSSDTTYSDTLRALNHAIIASGGNPIILYDIKSKFPAHRYLCSEADSSFALKKGTQISLAGKTTKYNLRLVKDSTITQ